MEARPPSRVRRPAEFERFWAVCEANGAVLASATDRWAVVYSGGVVAPLVWSHQLAHGPKTQSCADAVVIYVMVKVVVAEVRS
jgi:hypothetical protein